jgi:hypothetical protein
VRNRDATSVDDKPSEMSVDRDEATTSGDAVCGWVMGRVWRDDVTDVPSKTMFVSKVSPSPPGRAYRP